MNEMNEDEKKTLAKRVEQFRAYGLIGGGIPYNTQLNHLGIFPPPAAHNPERALVVRNPNLAITPYFSFKPFGK